MKAIIIATLAIFAASAAMAQQVKEGDVVQIGSTKRTILSVQDFPAGHEIIKLVAENPVGMCSGRHSHAGVETSYLIEGEITFKIDGQPDKVNKPGGEWHLDPGVVHDACATGDRTAKVLVIYVVEKGKPLAIAAK